MARLALVGFGKWGVQLLESVRDVDGRAQFSAIVSRSPERVSAEAGVLGFRIYQKLEEALTDATIDGIVLATPHSLHVEQVIACAEAGKHVFVEKPFALTRESCKRALDAVTKAGRVVAVGHNRRFLPATARMKSMITSGELGEIMHIETTYTGNAATLYTADHWRAGADESPAGGLAGSGIHMIDAIIGLAGPIASVFAIAARRAVMIPIEDTTAVLFTLGSGASASLTNIIATVPTYRIRVFGSKAVVELQGHEQLNIVTAGGKARTEQFPVVNTMRLELEAFAQAIEGGARYPISAHEILNGIATFEAVCKSVARGEKIVV